MLARDIGKLCIESIDEATGEKIQREVKAHEVQGFLKDEVVKSGDTKGQVERNLKKRKIENKQLPKRKKIIKSLFNKGKNEDDEKRPVMPSSAIPPAQSLPEDGSEADDNINKAA